MAESGDGRVRIDASQGFEEAILNDKDTVAAGFDDPMAINCRTCHQIHQTYTNADFGYNWTGSIGDYVWWDRASNTPKALTRDQVRNSPDIDTAQPVSRRREAEFFQYYGWPYYWTGAGLWGAGMYPGLLASETPVVMPVNPTVEHEKPEEIPETADTHLRSAREVRGYRIQARNGEIGHISDFLIDDETWRQITATISALNRPKRSDFAPRAPSCASRTLRRSRATGAVPRRCFQLNQLNMLMQLSVRRVCRTNSLRRLVSSSASLRP